MKRIVLTLSAICVLALPLMAQTPDLPQKEFVSIGASWNQYSAPQISGTLLYAHQISGGTYSFNLIDVISKSVKPFVVTTSISTGIAQCLRNIGPAKVFAVSTVGVAAGGENVGYSWTAGGCVVIPMKKGWSLMPHVRVIKSSLSDFQGIWGLSIGWGR